MRNSEKGLLRIKFLISLIVIALAIISGAGITPDKTESYHQLYSSRFDAFKKSLNQIQSTLESNQDIESDSLVNLIHTCRIHLKLLDFWWRYERPLEYKSMNAPLPVEWETEVFEKFEKPYRREGAGLSLAEISLDEEPENREEVKRLIDKSSQMMKHLVADSLNEALSNSDGFYYANRLFILNLAAIYSTGFECPDTSRIIPELKRMCVGAAEIYQAFAAEFPENALDQDYLDLYNRMLGFLEKQPNQYSAFNHFEWIKTYINPLYHLNATKIVQKGYRTRNLQDYSLNKESEFIFDKNLYTAQHRKGVFRRVNDKAILDKIFNLGELLFFDPILSGNNERSCASCHKPNEGFTAHEIKTAEIFNHSGNLSRNTPSLLNSEYNHLLMLDGKHLTLQEQAIGVMSNPMEMGSDMSEVMKKVMSIPEYARVLKDLLRSTPGYKEPEPIHLASVLSFYYTSYSLYQSAFDKAMNGKGSMGSDAIAGFNLFMSKAMCATCHFVPHFNGVKPPYIGSEFEVLGVPSDTSYKSLSQDSGRYLVHEAAEMFRAFRTGTLRNISKTAPYMHNGVFASLEEVMKFYNEGGGAGRGLVVKNQTLASDELGLTENEIKLIIEFMKSLDEEIPEVKVPAELPKSKKKSNNNRKVGGVY